MKQIFTLFFSLLVCVYSYGQKPRAALAEATTPPVIDGVIDDIWASQPANNVDKVYLTDVPTLGTLGTTYWKGLWDDKGIYILVNVNDNVFYPYYLVPGANDYKYDKIELYFDANYLKEDGKGANDGNGHYQVAYNFSADNINGTLNTDGGSGVKYAFKVNGGPYVAEYFVPYSKLKDSDGNQVDPSGEIGFDLYIIDSDSDQPERQRATWANEGHIAESYDVMDDCGIITLTGAKSGTYVDAITVLPDSLHLDNAITLDNDTIRFSVDILPAEASIKTVNWSVVNGTGKARINSNGLLTAISDGTVSVIASAADGSYVTGSLEITISGQLTDKTELSVLLGGTFDIDGPITGAWGKGGGVGSGSIIDGVVYAEVGTAGNQASFQLTQNGFIVQPDIPYVLMFDAWSDAESRVVVCDFEDPANSWTRYGVSPDGINGGVSEWNDIVSNQPQTFIHDVTFNQIKTSTINTFIFQLGNDASNVYIDNVFLFTQDDYEKIIAGVSDLKGGNQLKVYPNPVVNELNISLNTPKSKISVYNSLGQKLMESISTGSIAKINVSNLSKGIYFVKVNDGQGVKFIK